MVNIDRYISWIDIYNYSTIYTVYTIVNMLPIWHNFHLYRNERTSADYYRPPVTSKTSYNEFSVFLIKYISKFLLYPIPSTYVEVVSNFFLRHFELPILLPKTAVCLDQCSTQ